MFFSLLLNIFRFYFCNFWPAKIGLFSFTAKYQADFFRKIIG